MNFEVNKYIDDHVGDMVADLGRLVKIPSVSSESEPDAPFGSNCAKALDVMLSIAQQAGFTVSNFNNIMGEIDLYPGEEPELAALCHLDVVPAGTGWNSDPFSLTLKDGRAYGRGTADDKGPAIAVFYAMKAITRSRVKLNRNMRLIVGTDEECGSADLKEYRKYNKLPKMVFTADADFPVINLEKGMIRSGIKGKCKCGGSKTIASLQGGTVVNAVPGEATASVAGFSIDELNEAAAAMGKPELFTFTENGAIINIKIKGKAAHASYPRAGINAITACIALFANLKCDDGTGDLFKALNTCFPFGEDNGASLGIKMSDSKSGVLTEVLSIMDYSCGEFNAKFDIRFPTCGSVAGIKEVLTNKFEQKGFKLTGFNGVEPHYVEENSPFIRSLLKSYTEVTNKPGKCIAIGGGTYVHDIEGGVAFGANFPGDGDCEHAPNEYIDIKRLVIDAKVYANAILNICAQ